jgi:hypothetical protein
MKPKRYKMFDPLEELAKRRAEEMEAAAAGDKEPSKVHAWLRANNYEVDHGEDEYADTVAESQARRKKIKALAD